jgi:hypothetical protein
VILTGDWEGEQSTMTGHFSDRQRKMIAFGSGDLVVADEKRNA